MSFSFRCLLAIICVFLVISCKSKNKTQSRPTVSSSSSSSNSSSSASSSSASSSGSVVLNPLGVDLSISDVFPLRDSSNVALVSNVEVVFNQAVMTEGVDTTLISVAVNDKPIGGTIERFDLQSFRFTPSALLSPGTLYTVSVSRSVMSATGLVYEGDQWQFTTVADVYRTSQNVIDQCMNERDIAMLASVNAARVVERICGEERAPAVNRLSWSCQLQQAAIIQSEDMRDHDFFSHTGSDGSDGGERISRTGYQWQAWGENIAAGYDSVNLVMEGWLASPGHCVNLMADAFTEFGFGYTDGIGGTYDSYWSQDFAKAMPQ